MYSQIGFIMLGGIPGTYPDATLAAFDWLEPELPEAELPEYELPEYELTEFELLELELLVLKLLKPELIEPPAPAWFRVF